MKQPGSFSQITGAAESSQHARMGDFHRKACLAIAGLVGQGRGMVDGSERFGDFPLGGKGRARTAKATASVSSCFSCSNSATASFGLGEPHFSTA
jgi:hypothetical protein